MIELLTFSICVSFFCLGVFVCTQFKGMIFSFITDISVLPEFIAKPLFDCLPCMASIWSLVWWLLLFDKLHWHLILCIFMSCGINFIFGILVNYSNGLED